MLVTSAVVSTVANTAYRRKVLFRAYSSRGISHHIREAWQQAGSRGTGVATESSHSDPQIGIREFTEPVGRLLNSTKGISPVPHSTVTHTSSNKAASSNPFPTLSPTGDQLLKHKSLWVDSHSNHHSRHHFCIGYWQ